jgi:hypothetical protein
MPSQVLYPWTRFWMPSGTQIEHDERGYFADPEAKDRTYRANESRTTFSRLADTSAALILCGPPGSGKSTEIEGLRRGLEQKKGCAVLFYRAAALGNGNNLPQLTVQHKIWKEARLKDESLTLIVDGIDEALAREDTIIAQLLEVMNSDPLARLKVILTCRTADWQSSDDEYLREKFDVGEAPLVHHLCPLRWRDVAGAAAKHPDINSATFSLALWENGADSLAAWPITLKMLLREPEKLGGSRLDFYREYAGHMLNEWNDSRCRSAQSKFPHNQKLQIARRIAALTMFGAKYGVVSNGCGTPESGLLTTGDILAHDPREKLANQAQFDITEQAVDEVLATNLFECGNFDGGNVYTFSHRTYAELLAAEYVRELPLREIRRLICVRVRDKEHVAPQMAEVAAWIAGVRDDDGEFFEFLCQEDPEALLRADLSRFDDDRKKFLLNILLEKAKQGDPTPLRAISRSATSLKFDGMTELVTSLFLNREVDWVGRKFGFDLVRICKLQDAREALWKVLDDPDDPVRHQVIWPLYELLRDAPDIADTELENLERMARGDFGPDDDDDLKGWALSLLVPKFWPVNKVLQYLTEVQRSNYYGGYRSFLSADLPCHLAADDLLDLLEAVVRKPVCFDILSPFRRIAERTLELAFENLDQPKICEKVAEIWLTKSREFQPLPRIFTNVHESFDDERRRHLLKCALNLNDTQRADVFFMDELLGRDDLGWLLQQLPIVAKERLPVWCLAVRKSASSEMREEHLEALVSRYSEFSELRQEFPTPLQNENVHGAMLRSELEDRQNLEETRMARLVRNESRGYPAWRSDFDAGRKKIADGNIREGWIEASLSIDWHADGFAKQEILTNRPVGRWSLLSEEEKTEMKKAARAFLLESEKPQPSDGRKTRESVAGFSAYRLIVSDSNPDEELLSALNDKWIGSLVNSIDSCTGDHGENLRMAYNLNPRETLKWFRILLDRSQLGDGEGHLIELRGFESIWDASCGEVLCAFLTGPSPRAQSIRDGLEFLAKTDPDTAARVVCKIVESAATRLDEHASVRATVASGILHLSNVLWDRLWPLVIRSNVSTARALWQENIRFYDFVSKKLLSKFDSSHLAQLHLHLRAIFPSSVDLEERGGFVSNKEMCIDLRNDCLSELCRRGAHEQVEEILEAVAEHDKPSVRWYLLDAEQAHQQREWSPIMGDYLIRIVRSSEDTSFVRDADDLVDVLLVAISDWEHDLQKHSVEDLWSWDLIKNKRKNYRPKEEEILSNRLERWLKERLDQIVVNREVHIDRAGHRVDLKVEAILRHAPDQRLTVIIEVKRVHHDEIATAMETQLVQDYLSTDQKKWKHGIYLVGWYNCSNWEQQRPVRLKSKTIKGARSELEMAAARISRESDYMIRSVVVDCRISD